MASYDQVHSVFLERIGAIAEEGVRWVGGNAQTMRLNLTLLESKVACTLEKRIELGFAPTASTSGRRHRRQPLFARMSDAIDQDTKAKLVEVTEEVVDTAKEYRVPVPAADLPYIGFVHSLTIKQLLCGVIAGAVSSTIAVPFDVVQSRVIAGQGGRNVAQVVSTVAREEGLQSLMKGSLSFNIIKNSLEKGLQFATFESVKRNQQWKKGGKQPKVLPIPRAIPLSTAGGAAAGFLGTLISYPLQPVFSRLLLQPEKYNSMVGTLKEILRNEGGFRELYRGITPALISIIPSAALSFYTYETLKKKYTTAEKVKNPNALASLIIGGLAGAISSTITYPLEEARKQIVYSALSPKAVHIGNPHYNSIWQALQGIVKRDGVRGLYRGLTANTLQIIPATAVTFAVYEIAKRAFIAQGEEAQDEVKDASDLPPEEQSRMP